MLIPIFLSAPTVLTERQASVDRLIRGELGQHGIECRTLGKTDYPTDYPLREVMTLAKHCSGGVILGFSQFEATSGTWKKGTPFQSSVTRGKPVRFPTPWNQLEAGILFGLEVPLLVFREDGVSGGVFDPGATDVFIQQMPSPELEYSQQKALQAVFQKWTARVRTHYYGER